MGCLFRNLLPALIAGLLFFTASDLQAGKKSKEKIIAQSKKKDKIQSAGALKWHTDINKALAEAKKSKKYLIVFIINSETTNSINMEKKLFGDKRFSAAAKSLVLVKADFPRKKKVTPAEKKLAREVVKKYPPVNRRVPTVYFLDPSGKVLYKCLGYNKESAVKIRAMFKKLDAVAEKDKKTKKKSKK